MSTMSTVTEEAVQTASSTASVASEALETEAEDTKDVAHDNLIEAARVAGRLVKDLQTAATRKRWEAGVTLLPAVNAYLTAKPKLTPKQAYAVVKTIMDSLAGESSYDAESDVRLGVLLEFMSAIETDSSKHLGAIPYSLLVPCIQLVRKGESTEDSPLVYEIVPHAEEQVLKLYQELVADRVGRNAPSALRRDSVNAIVKGILADSSERESAALLAGRAELLAKAGLDADSLQSAIEKADESSLSDAARALVNKAGCPAVVATRVIEDVKAAAQMAADSLEFRNSKLQLELKLAGGNKGKGKGTGKGSTIKPPATPEDTRKAFEAELTAVSKNDSATEYRARLANTLIGKSVAVAVEVFSDLPGETLGSVELMEALLHGLKDAKPGTLVAILATMCKLDAKFRDSLGIAVARSKPENKPAMPAPTAQRSASVTVAPPE